MRGYLRISGLLFAVLTLAHLIRLIRHWPMLVAGRPIPLLASVIALFITGSMTVWAWRLLRSYPEAK